ncbi:ThiF family adenylyltransferase [Deinococcus soli (ex Cha et al. 2016)]|uniref:ThiF family adenylyltransferase n=1 Tax=Deinococcus soli (ex Cha et al. 2016) TaxID=1309411 RepID=UPI00166F4B8D|nr:ThiF family adenylyltransferase [Deinococcus soli (ex Cha et al. 2016)]GGB79782.1 hypothetical protein GCM10008019_40050 [Deinococcus soli (ex Cha et al. 2016)]
MPEHFSVALTSTLHDALKAFLLRTDGQEDLLFALYVPSVGHERFTALVTDLIYPEEGEREVHGNVSFTGAYLERVYRLAMAKGRGVVMLHSHLGPGWQDASEDDIRADQRVASSAVPATGWPLISMTLGTDGTWSARVWQNEAGDVKGRWATHVRGVGPQLNVSYAEHLRPAPPATRRHKRTVAVWGPEQQAAMTRLTVGVVGLGSVGSQVCEQLARSGFTRLVLIDHDRVEEHNLDRLIGAYPEHLGELKVDVAARNAIRSSTAAQIDVRRVPVKVTSPGGYRAALDCDVLFSCVDRPQPRRLLNHMAYAHLIPVIDGGIRVRHRQEEFIGVNWQVQTTGPTRPCLACVGGFEAGEADMDAKGLLDDPTYVSGLPGGAALQASENVFTFSSAVASMEMLQLVALVTGFQNFGVQRFDFNSGITEAYLDERQQLNCQCHDHLIATADTVTDWHAHDLALEAHWRT